MVTVGIVSAGAMGSALGARLREGGCRVVTTAAGRRARTRQRAELAGLDVLGSLGELLSTSDAVLSVVPPGAAREVARALAGAMGTVGRTPPVADLNAVSPETAAELAGILRRAGADLVDGSISGPPPTGPGTTRVYLSGPRAAEVAALPFAGVELRVVGEAVGLASAVKMCTASVYKGRVALLAQALRTAHAHGVAEHVLDDLTTTGVADRDRTGTTLARASAKAWRYVAEMEEIAATQAAAGLPPELFRAFAAVYAELADRAPELEPEDVPAGLALAEVLDALRPT